MYFLEIILYLLLSCFVISGVYTLIFTVSSVFPIKRQNISFKPKVSVIIPCRNEEDVIEKTLNSVKNQNYPDFEVIVVDDNSSDKTAKIVEKFIDLNGLNNFKLLKRKEMNSKKAKAVNDALKYAEGDVTVFFDADNRPENNCITNLVKRFSDDKIAAVQGRIFANITNLISKIVFMERCGGFNARFIGRERLGLNCQFGGTTVAVRTKILKALGGFNEETLTEDTYLTSNLIRQGYRIVYEPNAVVREEAPPNISNYITQRTRWASGHMKCFFEHALPILKAPISLKDKIDSLIFLAYYFIPILCGISIIIGITSIYFNIRLMGYVSIIGIILSLTPFLEIGIGVLRSKNKVNIYLLPSMMFFFVLNSIICFNAIFNILKGNNFWVKTERINTSRKIGKDTQVTMFSSVLVCLLLIGSVGSTFLSPLDTYFTQKGNYTAPDIIGVPLNSDHSVNKSNSTNISTSKISKQKTYKNQIKTKSVKITSNSSNTKVINSNLNQTHNMTTT